MMFLSVCQPDHAKMNIAFVGNSGHFGNERDLADSEGFNGKKDVNVKPQKIFSSSLSTSEDSGGGTSRIMIKVHLRVLRWHESRQH